MVGDVLEKLCICGEFQVFGFGNQGGNILFAQFEEVIVAIQGSIVRLGGFKIGNNACAAVVMVRGEPGFHIRSGGLGKILVCLPERGGMHQGLLGIQPPGSRIKLKDASVHHAGRGTGGDSPFFDRYHRGTAKLAADASAEADPEPGNIFMKLRYLLLRMGASPEGVEIAEAVELVKLYNEERAQMLCPLLGIT